MVIVLESNPAYRHAIVGEVIFFTENNINQNNLSLIETLKAPPKVSNHQSYKNKVFIAN